MITRVASFDRPLLIAIALLVLLLFQSASPQARHIVASNDERCDAKDRPGTCETDRQRADAFDYPALLLDSMAALQGGFTLRPSDAP